MFDDFEGTDGYRWSLILPLMVRTMEVVVVSFRSGFGFLRIHLVKDETAGLVHTLTTPKTYRRTS